MVVIALAIFQYHNARLASSCRQGLFACVRCNQGWGSKMKHRAKTAKEHSLVEPMDIRVHKINTTAWLPLLT